MTFTNHPAADVFPLLVDDELQELADDIYINGLIEPVVLLPDGRLLDGRNRVAACDLAGVDVRTRVYEGDDPIGYVVSLNLARRHLTAGQRAFVALEVKAAYAAEGRERQGTRTDLYRESDKGSPVDALAEAGKVAKVHRDTVSKATRIRKYDDEHGTDYESKVTSGEQPIDAVAKQVKRAKSQAEEQTAREITIDTFLRPDAEGDGWRMLHGDFRERLEDLPDGSVDMIVTDPPYPAEFLPLWSDLSKHAARVLTDDGVLVAVTGQIFLPDVMTRLGEHLNFGWQYVEQLTGSNSRIMGRHLFQTWKPWLAFTKNKWPSGRIEWHEDTLTESARSKTRYRWEQSTGPATELIDTLCPPGGTVLDPFTGSGTYGISARSVGRRFIGVEFDEDRFTGAVERLTNG